MNAENRAAEKAAFVYGQADDLTLTFKANIPNINIDYKGLTAFARNKGCKVCDLTDEEKTVLLQMQI